MMTTGGSMHCTASRRGKGVSLPAVKESSRAARLVTGRGCCESAPLGEPGQPFVEEHLRIPDLARRLQVSVRYLWDQVKLGAQSKGAKGIYPTRRAGKSVLVPASAVNRWLESITP